MILRLAGSNYLGFALALPVAAAGALVGSVADGAVAWWASSTLLALAALMVAGATYHNLRVRRFLSEFPPPGTMVRVNGRPMHLLAAGVGGAGPTVVWIPGSHDAGSELEHLHGRLTGEARSILVDRLGSGWSASASTPRRIDTEVDELAQALSAAGEGGPFILVGHSMGGTLAANFVARHPEVTAGAVLLDMGCTDVNLYADHLPGPKTIGAEWWLPVVAAFGLLWHVLPRRFPQTYGGTPGNARRLGFNAQPKTHVGWISCFRSVCKDPLAYVRNPGDLGDTPLFVVMPQPDFEADRRLLAPFVPRLTQFRLRNLVNLRIEARKANARLSSRAELRVIGTSHDLPNEVPDEVLALVREMIGRQKKLTRTAVSASSALRRQIEDSILRHAVPGASVAILRDGHIETATAGVLNVDTAAPVAAQSIFQIGSVTKTFTATLAMMQIDAGRLSLDDRVVDHLENFALADPDATRQITIRQLLCHTSGIDGDRLDDTGRNDDAVELLVAALGTCSLIHRPGAFFSYSNAAYIVLGRVLEQLEAEPWDRILRNRLIIPLGLSSATTTAEDALRRSAACGHETGAAGRQCVVKTAYAPRSNGPSGTTLAMSATDLVRFARFLCSGVAESGDRLLSEQSVSVMRHMQVQTPLSVRYRGWGLGLMLFGTGPDTVIGHDGGWAGQSAYLRLCPERQTAFALLANGGFPAGVFREVIAPLVEPIGGALTSPALGDTPPAAVDLDRYAGRYARFGQLIDLVPQGGRLAGTLSGPYVGDDPVAIEIRLVNSRQGRCVLGGVQEPIGGYFLEFDATGRPGYLHVTERAFRRTQS